MVSYKDIIKLSVPIMIGSAVQNLITLTDTIFLGRVGKTELGAIGLVGVFYLMIASIGYSFSKAGQIMIARRMGENKQEEIGTITYSMLAFALTLGTVMFLFMKFGSHWFFSLFINDSDVLQACVGYLEYRSYGVFFSYSGVIAVALYTGVARTKVIIYNAIVLGVVNTVLNDALIFGRWGLPQMGIEGAGLASSIAEVIAFFIFVIYILRDDKAREYRIFEFPKVNLKIIKQQLALSTPIILQSVVGLGSWFIFFTIVEDMGTDALAVSNVIRAVYLLLMIPCWGFASGINTIASNLIGKNKIEEVFPTITKTAILCFGITMLCGSLLVIAPTFVLRIGTDDLDLIEQAKGLIWVLLIILALFSVAAIYFNGLIGTGATNQALLLQIIGVIFYLGYIYIVVKYLQLEPQLELAWMAELFYWILTLIMAIWYLKSERWRAAKV